eukprot:4130873-Pyramimonas_sp.AAC.1
MLWAVTGTLRAVVWTLRAVVWTLRAVMWTLRAAALMAHNGHRGQMKGTARLRKQPLEIEIQRE